MSHPPTSPLLIQFVPKDVQMLRTVNLDDGEKEKESKKKKEKDKRIFKGSIGFSAHHNFRLLLTKLENIALTIITIRRLLSPLCLLLLLVRGRLHSDFVRLLFLQAHRETDRFFEASGVQLAQSNCGQFHYRRAAFSSILKSKCGSILAKEIDLRITLNIDVTPIASRSHTHPSHS